MSQEPSDYQKHLVLFVDDEEKTRKYFKRLFGDTFNILLASDGVEALEVLKQNLDQIGLIVTDQRMPNETGVAFLEKAALLKPSVVRILSTAFADIDAAIDSVNKGGVYRYITKPWDVADLELTLRRAMEYYILHSERDELLQQKILGVQTMALADRVVSLAALAAVRDSGLRYLNDALVASMQLHGAASARTGGGAQRGPVNGSWRDYYKQHHAFLNNVIRLLPKNITAGNRLAGDQLVDASLAFPTSITSDAAFQILPATGSVKFPGPVARAQEVLSLLLSGLKGSIGASDKIGLMECPGGLECTIPASALYQTLDPVFGSGAQDPGPAALALVGAMIGYAHHGGTMEVLAQPEGNAVKLRLNFNHSRLHEAAGNAIEDLAAELIGNELFWSRNAA